MPPSDASVPSKRRWWAIGAFGVVATLLIGQKCMCPDPAAAFRQQVTGSSEVHGAPMRVPAAPATAPAPVEATALAVATAVATVTVNAAPAAPSMQGAPAADGPVASVPAPAAETAVPSNPPEPVKAAEPETHPEAATTYKSMAWDDISKYRYVPPKPVADDANGAAAAPQVDQIPEDIRAMAGKRFVIDGFAVPLDYEKGIVKKLILLSAPLACCFAEAPPMNHWMTVTNDSGIEFDYSKYGVLRISGVFDVGEETREGYVVGIYRMRAEKIAVVEQ